MAETLKALAPRCILCSAYLPSPGLNLTQLPCRHVICRNCLPGLQAPDSRYYTCPITFETFQGEVENEEVEKEAALVLQHWDNLINPQTALEIFQANIQYSDVPCFYRNCCPWRYIGCPYDHENVCLVPCPDGVNCSRRRQSYCFYNHQEEFTSATSSSLVSGVNSNAIENEEVRHASLPPITSHVTFVAIDHSRNYLTSTIERMRNARDGTIAIKSESLYNYLINSSPSMIEVMLQPYGIDIQLTKLQPRILTTVQWLYETNNKMKAFPKEISATLDQVYVADPNQTVRLDRVRTVYFKPMVMLLDKKGCTPVHRRFVCKTYPAANIEVPNASREVCAALNGEIQVLEKSLLLPKWIPGELVKEVVDRYHLYIDETDMLSGIKDDLVKAQAELNEAQPAYKIIHIELRSSYHRKLVEEVARNYDILVVNNLIIGTEKNVNRLFFEDVEIAVDELQLKLDFLPRHQVSYEQGKLRGRLEDLSAALQEQEAPSLLVSYQNQENHQYVGPHSAVTNALARMDFPQEDEKMYEVNVVLRYKPVNYEPWVDLEGSPDFELVEILQDERLKIEALFQKAKCANIIDIKEIRNKRFRLAFLMQFEEVKRAKKDPVELFYRDFRPLNPLDIATSADGFSRRFFHSSTWGTCLTFTTNIKQVLRTAYKPMDRQLCRQVLLCDVIVGEVNHMKSDKTLISAPLGYHSVLGIGPAWNVYDENRAYPRYLISVEEPQKA